MSVADEQSAGAGERYRPLDISKNEIRLLSFQSTPKDTQIRLNLQYLSEAWKERYKYLADTPRRDIYKDLTRFAWGDYVCLSYAWGDPKEEKATIFLNGVATAVTTNLEGALEDLRSSFECQLGMKIWVDALCINQVDIDDRSEHVLRVKDIFSGSFSVTAYTKERGLLDHEYRPFTHRFLQCEVILKKFGRQVLEEALGIRSRHRSASKAINQQILESLEDIEDMVFDEYEFPQPSDDQWLYNLEASQEEVCMELWVLFKQEYWSRLWVIQELAFSPTTAKVQWGKTPIRLSTIQTLADIVLTNSLLPRCISGARALELEPSLELMAFTTKWRTLQTTSGVTARLDNSTIRQLNMLAQEANCSLPQDQVYGLLGLFPSPVSSAVVIDYSRETKVIIAEFCSMAPDWIFL